VLGEGRQRLELVDPDPIEDKCQGLTLKKMTYQKEIFFLYASLCSLSLFDRHSPKTAFWIMFPSTSKFLLDKHNEF
jgi:hypothetical protein